MSIELRRKRRITGTIAIAVAFSLLVFSLVKTQLIDGAEYKAASESLAVSTSKVEAVRGEILDSNGKPLVTNRQGSSVVFKYSEFPSSKNQDERNELIYSLINLFEKNKIEWLDRLPVIFQKGKLVIDEDKKAEFNYMVSESMLELESGVDATPRECLDALIERYGLKGYSEEDARKIASVCFGMKYLSFSSSNPYTFAEDVPAKTISTIMENNGIYPGVVSETVSYREYVNKTAFTHILGVVGSISSSEYEVETKKLEEKLSDETLTGTEIKVLKNNAYTLNDSYGKSGVEVAMEEYLRGVNGIKTSTTASDGSVKDEYLSKPVQGATVVTTIDAGLQEVATEALAQMLKENKNSSYFSTAGAIVVLDCNTGAVLACVSNPTYDITTYFSDYENLSSDSNSPLWNRALQSAYAPGSTMKPAIAIAALEEEEAKAETTCYCGGVYICKDQEFGCLSRHGYINVTTAIEKSCNIYFYQMGEKLGIDKMNKYCNLLGLGQKTGIELPEAEGVLAGVENKEAMGQVWNPGDTVQAAIGQSDNLFTPLQLANYAATIANGGTRYQPYIIKSVLSSDMSEVVYETEPTVLNTLNVGEETMDIVKNGMYRVVNNGTASVHFKECVVTAAGKTGTSQVKRTTESGVTVTCNNGFFISYAPYDDPEIAIAIVAENALSGSLTSQAAVPVYNYYFGQKTGYNTAGTANELIP